MLSLFTSISFAQQKGRYGLGFEFQTIPSTLMLETNNPQSHQQLGVYFPFETGSGFLIEPKLTYQNSSTEVDYDLAYSDDYEITEKNWSLVVGAFKLREKEKMRFYAGIRAGKSWYKREVTENDDVEIELFIIAPTIGAEYFITDNFTFGGEGMYSMFSSEDEQNDITTSTNLTILIPSFIVRFYF